MFPTFEGTYTHYMYMYYNIFIINKVCKAMKLPGQSKTASGGPVYAPTINAGASLLATGVAACFA